MLKFNKGITNAKIYDYEFLYAFLSKINIPVFELTTY